MDRNFINQLSQEDVDQLRIILEAQADVGAKFHGLVANALFKAYRASTIPADKLIYGLEIFCKLMQILEDLGLHCLMWLEAKKTGDPLGAFLNKNTKQIFKFYERCKLGLSDEELMLLHGIPSPEEALELGVVSESELIGYRRHAELSCECYRLVFRGFAANYVDKPDGQIGNLSYGDNANMYFNLKHGAKILWSNGPLSRAVFKAKRYEPTYVPILIGPKEAPVGSTAQRGLHFGGLNLTDEFVSRMNENCFHISSVLSKMAKVRLKSLSSPIKPTPSLDSHSEMLALLKELLDDSRISQEEKLKIKNKWAI